VKLEMVKFAKLKILIIKFKYKISNLKYNTYFTSD